GGNAQIKGMRKVAGSLRLDLASFRALEAFAQLGTELDAATQKQLDRGARMVEVLKQGQYGPMEVADPIFLVHAGAQGHLDSIPIQRVRDFEKLMLDRIRSAHSELRERIRSAKEIPADMTAKLDAAITSIRDEFLGGKKHDPR